MTYTQEIITKSIEFGAKQERERIEFMKTATVAKTESEFVPRASDTERLNPWVPEHLIARSPALTAKDIAVGKALKTSKPREAKVAPKQSRQTGIMKAVKSAIATGESYSIEELAQKIGAKTGTVRAALMALKKKGTAISADGAWYAAGAGAPDNPYNYGNGITEEATA